jgi:hypothetical protein
MRSVKNTERRLTNRNLQTVIVCAPTVSQVAVNRIVGGISEYLFVRQPYANDGEVAPHRSAIGAAILHASRVGDLIIGHSRR